MNGRREPALSNKQVPGAAGKSQAISRRRLHRSPFPIVLEIDKLDREFEIDELYIGLDRRGGHTVIPVQAKGGKDQIGIVQITQDIQFAAQKFPGLRCRPLAAQFMDGGVVALLELTLDGDEVKVLEERHYRLVPASQLDHDAIRRYGD